MTAPINPRTGASLKKTVKDVTASFAALGKPRNHDDVKGLDPKHK